MKQVLAVLLLASSLAGCDFFYGKDCSGEYRFTIPFTLSNPQDTFHIGDTIRLVSVIPLQLFDTVSQKSYSLGGFEHQVFGFIDNYDDPNRVNTGSSDFKNIDIRGKAVPGTIGSATGFRYLYKRKAGTPDSLEVHFVPQKKGLYMFTFATFTYDDYFFPEGLINDGCSELMQIYFSLNNRSADNNYEFVKSSPRIANKQAFDQGGGFAFRVE